MGDLTGDARCTRGASHDMTRSGNPGQAAAYHARPTVLWPVGPSVSDVHLPLHGGVPLVLPGIRRH